MKTDPTDTILCKIAENSQSYVQLSYVQLLNHYSQGLNHYSRMATNLNLTTIDQFPYCHHYRKFLNM